MGSSISLSQWRLMVDPSTIIRNCLCVFVQANRTIKWTAIHRRQVMGLQNLFPLVIYLCFFQFLFQLSLASASTWFMHRLSFSTACCCSPLCCQPSFLCPSVSILGRHSSFPTPVSFCPSLRISFPPLSVPLQCPSIIILRLSSSTSLLVQSISFALQCFQHFLLP